MNLILQSLDADHSAIARIASLADATAEDISSGDRHAWRCADVAYSPSLKALIDAACFGARIDCAWLPATPQLGDFKLLAMDMDFV